MNTHDAHLQGLTNQELDSVARQILDEAKRLECFPNDLWTAVRMTAMDDESMVLHAVGMVHSDEYPKGHDWTYTPGGQVVREIEHILHARIGREWVNPEGTEKVLVQFSGYMGNYPPQIQSQPLHGVWVSFYAHDGQGWVPVEGTQPEGLVVNTRRAYMPYGDQRAYAYLMSLGEPMKVTTTVKTLPIPCSNEVRVGLGQQFLLKNGTKTRSLGYQGFYTWKEYHGNRAPVGSIIRQYNEVQGQRGWEYWEVISV